jgi:hypothetical protein
LDLEIHVDDCGIRLRLTLLSGPIRSQSNPSQDHEAEQVTEKTGNDQEDSGEEEGDPFAAGGRSGLAQ